MPMCSLAKTCLKEVRSNSKAVLSSVSFPNTWTKRGEASKRFRKLLKLPSVLADDIDELDLVAQGPDAGWLGPVAD